MCDERDERAGGAPAPAAQSSDERILLRAIGSGAWTACWPRTKRDQARGRFKMCTDSQSIKRCCRDRRVPLVGSIRGQWHSRRRRSGERRERKRMHGNAYVTRRSASNPANDAKKQTKRTTEAGERIRSFRCVETVAMQIHSHNPVIQAKCTKRAAVRIPETGSSTTKMQNYVALRRPNK